MTRSVPTTCALIAGLAASPAFAASIGISFNRNTDEPFASTDTAGAVPQMNWTQGTPDNSSGPIGETFLDLLDDSGAATTTDVTFSGANHWAQGATGDANVNLLKGYIDDGGAGGNVAFTDIPYAEYDVYIYGLGDGAQGSLLGGYTVDDGTTSVSADWLRAANLPASGGTLIEGSSGVEGHYFRVTGLTGSSLTVTNDSPAGGRSPLAGVQIVEVPEPASAALAGLGAVCVLARRRRRA